MAHEWKPVREGDSNVVAIAVRTTLSDFPASASFSLTVPIMYAGVPDIALHTEQLSVRDARGEIALTITDDAPNPGGFPYYRHYRAERAVQFPLTYSYRAKAPRTSFRGPPFGLLAAYGGVSGAGAGFLVLPEISAPTTSTVHWDLTDLAPGSRAAMSLGDGDLTHLGPAADLQQSWIMAGPIGRYPATGDAPFMATWLGTPAWEVEPEMTWAAEMYAFLGKSYGYLNPLPPYRVFVQVGTFRGGTALASSFLGGAAPRAPGAAAAGESPRQSYTHEMGHLFVGAVDAPDGISSWFSEGLNTYYTRLLPMRGGFTTVEAYGREINKDFTEYWSSPSRNLSADSIVKVGFNDNTIRHMPYVRGSLYFADLDTKIRAFSRGRRTLDTMLRELFVARAAGTSITHDRWIAAVVRDAGPSAKDDFEHVILLGDRTLLPSSNAFGPCFERREVPATTISGGAQRASYEWVRIPSVPDSQSSRRNIARADSIRARVPAQERFRDRARLHLSECGIHASDSQGVVRSRTARRTAPHRTARAPSHGQ